MAIIYLYGPPASGKTTLGRRLAEALSWDFTDLDAEIVAHEGREIKDIFAKDGEKAFRLMEGEALARVTLNAKTSTVIALGGGTLLDDANRAFASEKGKIWCLDTPSKEEVARRIAAGGDTRPLGDMSAARAAHYASFPSRVAASFYLPGSLVVVGCALGDPRDFAPLVIADSTAASLHGVGGEKVFTIPSGEERKNLETVASIWRAFHSRGVGRRDMVAAFGGGVTGDLTGFAAATWMRGVPWINFPTTLLSMVDASTGGKTGCDLPEGKNLVGAFHAPRLVVIDSSRLATLPARELRGGRAEMIKHDIIAGRDNGLANPIPSPIEIADNLSVKVGIVREDPFERTGRRILLNCGHTVGHALEIATGFAVSHGEAVAIGCVEEARLAVRLGLASAEWPERLAARFADAGLPTALPEGFTFDSLAPLMRGDKKRYGSSVTFALPCGPGDVRPIPCQL